MCFLEVVVPGVSGSACGCKFFCSSSVATAQRSSDIRSLPRLLISYLSGLGSDAAQHEKTAVLTPPTPKPPRHPSPFPTAKNTARLVSNNRRHPGVAWQREFSVSRFALRAAPLSSSRPSRFLSAGINWPGLDRAALVFAGEKVAVSAVTARQEGRGFHPWLEVWSSPCVCVGSLGFSSFPPKTNSL